MYREQLYLTEHRIRVNLTHVDAAVGAVDVADVQRPCVQIAVQDRQARVVSQHSVVHSQDAFVIGFDPSHLRSNIHAICRQIQLCVADVAVRDDLFKCTYVY